MRRTFIGMVVAIVTAVIPIWAMAGNQEVAEHIAAELRKSGQLEGYMIGVKYQEGTAWLRGRVSSSKQLRTALKLVSEQPNVTRVINQLTVETKQVATKPVSPTKRTLVRVKREQSLPSLPVSTPHPRPLRQVSGTMPPAPQPILSGPETPSEYSEGLSRSAKMLESIQHQPLPAERLPSLRERNPVQTVMAVELQQPTPAEPRRVPVAAPRLAAEPKAQRPLAPPQPMVPVPTAYQGGGAPMPMPVANRPLPQYITPVGGGVAPARYDQPHMPNYSWPSYAAHPNYAAVTYPKQYSPTAWPYIGPFYPYPQVPMGWRKVSMEWHDGWWQLDFDDGPRSNGILSGLFRSHR